MSKIGWRWILCGTMATVVGACGGDDETTTAAGAGGSESLDAHVCEHLTGGPFEEVTAAERAASAPDVTDDHTAFRVTLPEIGAASGGAGAGGELGGAAGAGGAGTAGSGVAGAGGSAGYGGFVRLSVSEAGDLVLFFDADVPVVVRDGNDVVVPIEESCDPQSCSDDCPELRGRHVLELAVGSYSVEIGPTPSWLVTFAHEHADHHHD